MLEEVDGLAHLDLLYGRVVGDAPEVLDGLDELAQCLDRRLVVILGLFFVFLCDASVEGGEGRERRVVSKSCFCFVLGCMARASKLGWTCWFQKSSNVLVEPELPVMLRGQSAHGLEEIPLRIVALLCRGADVWRGGIDTLGERREASCEEAWSAGHGGLEICGCVGGWRRWEGRIGGCRCRCGNLERERSVGECSDVQAWFGECLDAVPKCTEYMYVTRGRGRGSARDVDHGGGARRCNPGAQPRAPGVRKPFQLAETRDRLYYQGT